VPLKHLDGKDAVLTDKWSCQMVINTNIGAARASRLLADSTSKLNGALSRLASGSKIVSPQDDAAGLAVSTKFEAMISRNNAAANNVSSALSYSQTQDGFLGKVSKALDRMSELMNLAKDATKSTNDKENYNTEFTDLKNYISDLGTKEFNGVSLFDGSGLAVTKDSEGTTWSLNASDLNDTDITSVIASGFTVTSTMSTLTTSIENVSTHRAQIGGNIQRLQLTNEQLGILSENLAASVSRIKDVDVATESTQFARYNILVQSGTAMLAQANLLPQSALRLLQ